MTAFKVCLISFISVCCFLVNKARASAVEFQGTPQVVSASGIDVKIYPQAMIHAGEVNYPVKLSGYGIRTKSVLFLDANIYMVASYVDDPALMQPLNLLQGIRLSKGKVLQLTMLRSLTGEQVSKSLEDALRINGVDVSSGPVKNVLSQFSVALPAGHSALLIGFPKADAVETLAIEFLGKDIKEEGKSLALDFWRVWFGTPVDGGIKKLQAELVR
ncbi:MAG: hypothetical protein HY537_03625 [Deltaproteobacteria bacterium]|nr:hypothetical protein [Deltaproteobacteria bacterium]